MRSLMSSLACTYQPSCDPNGEQAKNRFKHRFMKRALLLIFCTFCLSAFVFAQSKQSASKPAFTNKVEIQVFPNPVQTHFSINNNAQVKDIVVFNLVGKELKRFVYSDDERYFLGDLPKGIYLVQFVDKQKNILTTRRISKR